MPVAGARRLTSPILSAVPWYTTALSQCENFLDILGGHIQFEKFIRHLHRYESLLLGMAGSSRLITEMQRLLGFGLDVTGPVTSPPTHVNLSATEWTRLCGVISAYRLLDVIFFLGDSIPRTLNTVERQLSPNGKSLHGMDKLEDWPRILLDFRKMAKKATMPAGKPLIVGVAQAPIRLLHMIAQNEISKDYCKVKGNFLHAAMHIACMNDLAFTRESYPDIPDKVEALSADGPQLRDSQFLADEEREDVQRLVETLSKKMSTGEGLSFLRAPLQLSLLISPIYLLLPMQLVKKSFNRQIIISSSIALGSGKTDLILEVERAIWGVVLSLAQGTLDPSQLLCRLCETLPWLQIESAAKSENESRWFQLDRPHSHTSGHVAGLLHPAQNDSPSALAVAHHSLSATLQQTPLQPPFLDNTPMDVLGDSITQNLRTSMQVDKLPSNVQPPSLNTGFQAPLGDGPNNDDVVDDSVNQDLPTPMEDDFPTPAISGDERMYAGDNGEEQSVIKHHSQKRGGRIGDSDNESLGRNSGDGEDAVDGNDEGGDDSSDGNDDSDNESLEHNSGDGEGAVDGNDEGGDDSSDRNDDSDNESLEHNSGDGEDGVDGDDRGGDDSLDISMDLRSSAPIRPELEIGSKRSSSRLKPQPRGQASSKIDILSRKRRRGVESKPLFESDEGEGDDPLLHGGTSAEPIDVDLYCSIWEPRTGEEFIAAEEISLQRDRNPPKILCDKELKAFDAEGNMHNFRPMFHYKDYNTRLKRFFACIEAGYQDGQPLHIADPDRSGFAIMTCTAFQNMPLDELHALFRRKNVVVTGFPYPILGFDEVGLRTVSPLDSQVSIQDYTCPPKGKGNFSAPETISGLVRDILENGRNPDGKILNGLDFPMWDDSPRDRSSTAVDVVAFDYMRGKPHCGGLPYPTGHMSWGLAGTANTVTFVHIDCDGFSTFIRVMCGKKVWAIYREDPELPLSSINVFLHKKFRLDDLVDGAKYGFEAIVLRPGDLLFMQPGCPHFVYGPENTICHGGHYYATCLMQATLQSVVHNFVVGVFITNTTHQPSRLLLRRIILFYGLGLVENRIKVTDTEYSHLPDVQTFDGLLDLLSASILAILGNVLDLRTYSAPNQGIDEQASDSQKFVMKEFDRNNIPTNERTAICYARGMALAIFKWVRKYAIIKDRNGNVVEDLPSRFLVQILNALLNYKAQAIQGKLKGAPHCDLRMLQRQIANVLTCDTLAGKVWENRRSICDDSLAFGPKEGYSVEWAPLSGEDSEHATLSYKKLGTTPFDVNFWKGEALRSNLEAHIDGGPPLKKPRNS